MPSMRQPCSNNTGGRKACNQSAKYSTSYLCNTRIFTWDPPVCYVGSQPEPTPFSATQLIPESWLGTDCSVKARQTEGLGTTTQERRNLRYTSKCSLHEVEQYAFRFETNSRLARGAWRSSSPKASPSVGLGNWHVCTNTLLYFTHDPTASSTPPHSGGIATSNGTPPSSHQRYHPAYCTHSKNLPCVCDRAERCGIGHPGNTTVLEHYITGRYNANRSSIGCQEVSRSAPHHGVFGQLRHSTRA
ncbi:hypothetical protein N656DRAFT_388408 [Canariomyces notabilis]|uniref:Uncharacterized protein n=1 Tax=Canariomyces notabilis TaxID=2074819 RepID=A0AAN6TKI5_9PEZI|nr:hypothetical protein N656DRAFT_388408 [Canariomyces arenarius]